MGTLCADSVGLNAAQSWCQDHRVESCPWHLHIGPMQSLSLHQSFPLPCDVKGMGSIPVVTLVVCTHPTLPEMLVGRKTTPEPLQTLCFHTKPQCNPHMCWGADPLGRDCAPIAPQHPPLQLLQGDSDPQAVSQEEEGGQDVSPLHHLAQWAPLQHPRAENVPRLLCQKADVNQDLERQGKGWCWGKGTSWVFQPKMTYGPRFPPAPFACRNYPGKSVRCKDK